MELRDYQHAAVTAVEAAWDRGQTRPLIALATGLGKTVIFSELIRRHPERVLVLAHRDELLRQTAATIRAVVGDRRVGRVQADQDDADAPIVVASVQSLHARRLQRTWNPGAFPLCIIDEAHHANAPSYQAILQYLEPPRILGVTATPFRADRVSLAGVFDAVVYEMSIKAGMDAGWLTDIRAFRLETSTNLDPVATQGGDFAPGALELALDSPPRNQCVVDAVHTYSSGRHTVVFAAGVDHAQHLGETLRAHGIAAVVITGHTPIALRQQWLAEFHAGQIPVLVNIGVLTEGWDDPAVACIILARPTKSLPLFTQMIGRGVRPSPETGKTALTVVDLVDTTQRHQLVSVGTLLGILGLVPQGASIRITADQEAQQLPVARAFWGMLTPRFVPEPHLLADWIATGPLPAADWRAVADDLEEWAQTPEAQDPKSPALLPLRLAITPAQRYTLVNFGWDEAYLPTTARAASWAIDRHLLLAAAWAQERIRVWQPLLRRDSSVIQQQMFSQPWHFKPATAKQLQALELAKVPPAPYPLTAGEASWCLDQIHRATQADTANVSS